MTSFFIRALLYACTCVFMSCGLADEISPDVAGVSIRLDSTLVPIPSGFVIESVNVREIGGEEVEELRFVSTNNESLLRSIDVYRRRSLFESSNFRLASLLHFGDLAKMTECNFGPFVISRADYEGFPASTKVAIMRENYQVMLLGPASPRAAVALLENMEEFQPEGEEEHFDQLRGCLFGNE